MYCELVGTSNLANTKVRVEVDFGQANNFWKKDKWLKDDKGEIIKFNSMIDAMNYMGLDGWDFVQAYTVSHGNSHVYHYVLRKRLESLTPEQKEEAMKKLKE